MAVPSNLTPTQIVTEALKWGVRNDSAATSLTDTNGDYTPIATDSNGRLFINAISSIFSVTPGAGATIPAAATIFVARLTDKRRTG